MSIKIIRVKVKTLVTLVITNFLFSKSTQGDINPDKAVILTFWIKKKEEKKVVKIIIEKQKRQGYCQIRTKAKHPHPGDFTGDVAELIW